MDITVAEYSKRYYMDPTKAEYQEGFNEFSWDATIINGLKINLRSLHAKVEVKRNPNIIAPAILYHVPLPKELELEAYRFVFVPSVEGDVDYHIEHNREIKASGSLEKQPAGQPTFITWKCEDASEGWHKLRTTFRFGHRYLRLEKKININYSFYHKPVINIPTPEP